MICIRQTSRQKFQQLILWAGNRYLKGYAFRSCWSVLFLPFLNIQEGIYLAEKKYYWLRLKNDFFDRKDIKIIENMENGKDYIIFLLKLKLRSLEGEGYLRVSETIPYNEKMLATITNTDIDIVRTAMKVFIEFGLIEILENRTIYMACIEQLIGKETGAAERMRLLRARKVAEKQLKAPMENNVTSQLQNSYTKKEIELKKEIKKDKYKKEPELCDNTKLKGTLKRWCKLMVNRYCPDKNFKQCMEWFNEYKQWLYVYLVHEKKIVERGELPKFCKSKQYYPIFENQLKNWMEKDDGMPNRIKKFWNKEGAKIEIKN